AELNMMLTSPLTFSQVPALEDRLARLRREGGAARAAALASRAARALEDVAARELDRGEIDAGVAHYKIALSVDPGAPGTSQLAATLRGRAETSLRADHAGEAVRWARTVVGLAEADPDAHALLAEALSASHDDAAAAVEYGKALASRPADPAFKRGLARARQRVARSTASRARQKAVAATRDPAASETAPAADDDAEDDEKSSAEAKSEAKAEQKSEARSASGSTAGSTSGESTPEK
ncbi:MAG TPA: hypothetical protein VMT47_05665, partial [Polyangia bacterium]|nr:hypothetical protein [Polyangia bacterium]